MAKLLDLPPEVLSLIFGHLHDENVSLRNVSLTGHKALTAAAQDLMLRDLRICVKFPIPSSHPFQPAFRRICNTPALRNTVRSLTFKCRSDLANLDLMNLFQKNLGKLKSVTHVRIICSAHSLAPHPRYNTCITPTLLISVLRLPALHTLVVDDCLIYQHVIPDSLCSCSLRVLVLDTSTSARAPFYPRNGDLTSLLHYTPAVSAIEMRGIEPQSPFITYESCLSSVLERIVPGREKNMHSCQPRRIHLVCNCENSSCLYSDIITPLSTALESFKVLEEIVVEKIVENDALHTAEHSFLEISVAGCGILKRLSLNFRIASYGEDTTFLCEALQRLSVLEEVTLECDGYDEEALIACIAAHPTLRCVYFDVELPNDVDVHELALRIAGQARQLTLIAWQAENVMAQINEDRTVEMKVYEEPRWLQFAGDDTKWWEDSRF